MYRPHFVLQAAYNGICLAAENGETGTYSVEDVSIKDDTIRVKYKSGRPIRVTIAFDD